MNIKPNLSLSENRTSDKVNIYFDGGSKTYGIRQSQEVIHDGVHITTQKSIDMTLEQLDGLIEQARRFLGIHKKF